MATFKNETARGVNLLQTDVTPVITNSTTETTIFSYIIPGGKMGVSKTAKFSMVLLLTTGLIPPTLTFRVRLGTATITIANGITLNASLTSFPFTVEGEITNMGANNVQYVKIAIKDWPVTVTPVGADWVIDTSADQTLSASVQFGALSTSTTIFPKKVALELS